VTASSPRPAAPEVCRCGLSRGTAVHGNPFGAGHTYDPAPAAPDTTGGELREAQTIAEIIRRGDALQLTADEVAVLDRFRDLLAERDKLNDLLREAGIEYPLGLRGVSDLVDQREGHRQRVEEAEAERDKLAAQVQALADDFDANGNSCPLGDSTGGAWHKAARILRALGTPTTGGGE
jgi:hypothetical protein